MCANDLQHQSASPCAILGRSSGTITRCGIPCADDIVDGYGHTVVVRKVTVNRKVAN